MKSTIWSESRYLDFQQIFALMANSGFCQPDFMAFWVICQPAQNRKVARSQRKLRGIFQKLFLVGWWAGAVFGREFARVEVQA